jgi:hypothetical protein
MARSVNITTSGWQATGSNVSVPQYTLTVKFDWIDNSGVSHTGTQTATFPNVLAQLPADYVANAMQNMLIDFVRSAKGVDS